MQYLIYKYDKNRIVESQVLDLETITWKPSFRNIYHNRLPKKYILWWFFHYLSVFENNQFEILFFYNQGELAHFFCIVPKYYRWSFMKKKDVQLTYVVTEKNYQGKGIAFKCISNSLIKRKVIGDIWYVTDSENIASQKLAEKLGFKLQGTGIRKSYLFGLIKILSLKKLS